jgi:cob(I)alamin adenosyltransferase
VDVKRAMVQIYTGDGKGKTTAAFGLALRAAGQGLRVMIFQFLKGGAPLSGELKALQRADLPIEWRRFDDQVPPLFSGEAPKAPPLQEALKSSLREVEECIRGGKFDLVILDELVVALAQGWVAVDEVIELLRRRPPAVEVVLTGRGAPQALVTEAELVSEIREIKHPFRGGVPARKGIEY